MNLTADCSIQLFENRLEWPEIRVEKENEKYAMLLKDDYIKVVNRLVAICQYRNSSFFDYKDLINLNVLIENISIMQIKYLNILAETIILLGGNPKINDFDKRKYKFPSSKSPSNAINFLKDSIEYENITLSTYSNHIEIMDDPFIKNILTRIVLDKIIHKTIFEYYIHLIENKCEKAVVSPAI